MLKKQVTVTTQYWIRKFSTYQFFI